MSVVASRDYLRSRARAVGLKEWSDGFNFSNIPSTIVNNSFHIEPGTGSGVKLNQEDQEISISHTIRVFIKGYRDVSAAIDSATKMTEDLIKEVVTAKNRLTQPNGIKNVTLDGFNFDASDQTNDNLVVASITFRIFVVLAV